MDQTEYLSVIRGMYQEWVVQAVPELAYLYGKIVEVNGALVRIIRETETVPDGQLWPTLGPWTPEVGQDVFCARVDRGLIVLGPLNVTQPIVFGDAVPDVIPNDGRMWVYGSVALSTDSMSTRSFQHQDEYLIYGPDFGIIALDNSSLNGLPKEASMFMDTPKSGTTWWGGISDGTYVWVVSNSSTTIFIDKYQNSSSTNFFLQGTGSKTSVSYASDLILSPNNDFMYFYCSTDDSIHRWDVSGTSATFVESTSIPGFGVGVSINMVRAGDYLYIADGSGFTVSIHKIQILSGGAPVTPVYINKISLSQPQLVSHMFFDSSTNRLIHVSEDSPAIITSVSLNTFTEEGYTTLSDSLMGGNNDASGVVINGTLYLTFWVPIVLVKLDISGTTPVESDHIWLNFFDHGSAIRMYEYRGDLYLTTGAVDAHIIKVIIPDLTAYTPDVSQNPLLYTFDDIDFFMAKRTPPVGVDTNPYNWHYDIGYTDTWDVNAGSDTITIAAGAREAFKTVNFNGTFSFIPIAIGCVRDYTVSGVDQTNLPSINVSCSPSANGTSMSVGVRYGIPAPVGGATFEINWLVAGQKA